MRNCAWCTKPCIDLLVLPSVIVLPQDSSKLFPENPVVSFPEVDKLDIDIFDIGPRFLENLLESEKLVCCAIARTKTTLGILQLRFNYLVTSFFKALVKHFCTEVKERDVPVISPFSPVYLLTYRRTSPVYQYFGLLSFERVLLSSTAWPRWISGQVLNSHSVVSSSRTVMPCSPWGGRWIRHWRTTWSTVCSSAPHSQAAEEAKRAKNEELAICGNLLLDINVAGKQSNVACYCALDKLYETDYPTTHNDTGSIHWSQHAIRYE